MIGVRLYLAQRLSALVMAPLVLGHLAVMIYAVQDGLSALEILSRTRGSVGWALYYGTFVLAVSIHGAIGLRVVVYEVFKVKGSALEGFTWAVFLFLLVLGARAVMAVTWP